MKQAIIMDGRALARELCEKIKKQINYLKEKHHITPGLAVMIIGEDPASQIYVRNKIQRTTELGMNSYDYQLDYNISEEILIDKIHRLNMHDQIHGILVQLPLPPHINNRAVINAIDPKKDVDGFTIVNAGKLMLGENSLIPCTPQGCLLLLKKYLRDNIEGKKVVIIGRSNIVGKPMGLLLLQEGCTVTWTHSKTREIGEELKRADIIIAALGKGHFVGAEWVKEGATVIDVGISRDKENKIIGDVDFTEVSKKAEYITPMPGGVGPMTVACLLANTVKACCWQHKITLPEELL